MRNPPLPAPPALEPTQQTSRHHQTSTNIPCEMLTRTTRQQVSTKAPLQGGKPRLLDCGATGVKDAPEQLCPSASSPVECPPLTRDYGNAGRPHDTPGKSLLSKSMMTAPLLAAVKLWQRKRARASGPAPPTSRHKPLPEKALYHLLRDAAAWLPPAHNLCCSEESASGQKPQQQCQ